MLAAAMQEAALQIIRAATGWTEHPSNTSWKIRDYLFQCGDAKMTILLDGSWECQICGPGPVHVYLGKVGELEQFLRNFPMKKVKAASAGSA